MRPEAAGRSSRPAVTAERPAKGDDRYRHRSTGAAGSLEHHGRGSAAGCLPVERDRGFAPDRWDRLARTGCVRSVSTNSVARVVALALALAGCGEAVSGTDPSRAGEENGRGSTLFLAGDGELWAVDVDAERAEHLRMPELAAGDPPHRIAAIGDRLALWGYDVAGVPIADPSGPPTTLANDGWIFILAAEADRIWVGFLDPASPATERALGELREIDADGNVITRGVEPPDGAWPYAELTSGLLLQGPGPVRLWNPESERTVRTYPWEEIGDMGPVTGDLLASCRESCEELILTDFAAAEQRRIRAPSGLAFVAFEAAFSPDAATLAVPVKKAGGGWRSYSTNDRELALVSLESGETEIVPDSTVSPGYVFTAWSPAGDQVFITGGERRAARDIVAYRLGETRARVLDVEVGDFYDIATG
jgi:hypothetical protein